MSLIKWIVKVYMAELHYIIKQNFRSSFNSLKNTSYDKQNNIYMCQSSMEVVDFDHLTFVLNPAKQPSSYDSLIIEEKDKKVFCIEFKNQSKSNVNNTELYKKVEDSEKTLRNICATNNIKKENYNFILCIVYKTAPNKHKYHRFKENIIHFGLDIYRDKYFKEIITNDIEFFKKEFLKIYSCS